MVTGPLFKEALVRAELEVAVVVWAIEDLGLTMSFGKTEVVAFMVDDAPEVSLRVGREGR